MSKDKKHKCIICGVEYEACDTCRSQNIVTPWKVIADTQNHYRIHLIITDYAYKIISKKKAKSMLKQCDLSGIASFEPNAIKLINEINKEELSIVNTKNN